MIEVLIVQKMKVGLWQCTVVSYGCTNIMHWSPTSWEACYEGIQ